MILISVLDKCTLSFIIYYPPFAYVKTNSHRITLFAYSSLCRNPSNSISLWFILHIHTLFLYKADRIYVFYTQYLYIQDAASIYLKCSISIPNVQDQYTQRAPSVLPTYTISITNAHRLYFLQLPATFLFLELYLFLYPSILQQDADFLSFLFVLSCRWSEIAHSRYAENA